MKYRLLISLLLFLSSMVFPLAGRAEGTPVPEGTVVPNQVEPRATATDFPTPTAPSPAESPDVVVTPPPTTVPPTPTDLPPTPTAPVPTPTEQVSTTAAPATVTPTEATPTEATSTLSGVRPVVVLASYKTKPGLVTPGKDFNLEFKLVNQGQIAAHNLIVNITAGDFVPRETGGVLAVGELSSGEKESLKQPLAAGSSLAGNTVATLEVKLSYTDPNGVAYNEVFTIALNLEKVYTGSGSASTPTPTPSNIKRAQLVISSYQTDTDPLQPGTQFMLALKVLNAGNADASRVTMVVGGATITTDSNNNESNNNSNLGNVNASSGEFTNFSPVGVSNVQSLGDLPMGKALDALQPLIVNVTTNPGAYSLKISFVYNDEKGNQLVDDQVISLLVYSLPVVEMNFYRDPGPLFNAQPNMLPVQVINLGKKTAILGNLRVTAPTGFVENNTALVGALEPGGYFTWDVTYYPDAPGSMEVVLAVDYTDDFNQPHTITDTITVEVQEAPVMDPGTEPGMGPEEGMPGEMPGGGQPETLVQKVKRFVFGMLGLDSGAPQPFPGGDMPSEGIPPGEGAPPVIMPPSPGKG